MQWVVTGIDNVAQLLFGAQLIKQCGLNNGSTQHGQRRRLQRIVGRLEIPNNGLVAMRQSYGNAGRTSGQMLYLHLLRHI